MRHLRAQLLGLKNDFNSFKEFMANLVEYWDKTIEDLETMISYRGRMKTDEVDHQAKKVKK